MGLLPNFHSVFEPFIFRANAARRDRPQDVQHTSRHQAIPYRRRSYSKISGSALDRVVTTSEKFQYVANRVW